MPWKELLKVKVYLEDIDTISKVHRYEAFNISITDRNTSDTAFCP